MLERFAGLQQHPHLSMFFCKTKRFQKKHFMMMMMMMMMMTMTMTMTMTMMMMMMMAAMAILTSSKPTQNLPNLVAPGRRSTPRHCWTPRPGGFPARPAARGGNVLTV